ncbi:hypothetical protein JCM9140_1002 [Halalkalibacter wakoensis JCM 9140]|uniref:YpoC-like domain-containing protein n=1 Tax=Halalkalibacter wakoensis JCM 9140 TaxID=1236970 RepID=W4PZ70_9BACI|nr:hypothetical protein [Halalkalibacter wakoensis]GAE25032.1 hypothetical protein JCM9140_1002 [Halalkalibacter wakoensis JCM 9140]
MNVTIPESFQVSPFYQQTVVNIDAESLSFLDICQAIPFYYDITMEKRPWEEKDVFVPMLFACWDKERPILEQYYKDRNPLAAKEKMNSMLALLIDALFWLNGRQVTNLTGLTSSVQSLLYKPVNVEERLEFILLQAGKYHSYVQLKSLFIEVRKLYARVKIMELKEK